MRPITCLVVDDERLARKTFRRFVEANPALELVGEAATTKAAIKMVEELQPRLLFLDIQMPGGGGFGILNSLKNPPAVIFITAHDNHAIRAFEVNALDYLLKPVSPGRFEKAVENAVRRIDAESSRSSPAQKPEASDPAILEIGESGHFVAAGDVLFIEADGNYTLVATNDGRQRIVRRTIKDWARNLPKEMFAQLDRSLILNRSAIKSAEFSPRSARVEFRPGSTTLSLGAIASSRLRRIIGH